MRVNVLSYDIARKKAKMDPKLVSFFFVISLTFGVAAPIQVKDVPFNVNEVINRVSPHHSQPPYPQPLTPDLTGEFLIDTSIIYTTIPGSQLCSAIAFDGTNYLVIWEDMRSGESDIYGTRVNRDGIILDPDGIVISVALGDQSSPSLAFDGTNYLVVWQDYRNNDNYDIYGARVNQSGVVLDTAGITISISEDEQEAPTITFDGTNYLVVWQDIRSGEDYDIYCSRVNQFGVVLDPDGIAVSTAEDEQESPAITFDGTNYLVAWEDSRSGDIDIYGSRVNRSGIVLDTNGIIISTAEDEQKSPSIAFDANNYLVVWQDCRSGEDDDIYGARISQTGIVLDPNGIIISFAASDQYTPRVAFDGTDYLVSWEDYRNGDYPDIYGTRLSQAGLVIDPNGIFISNAPDSQMMPCVAFDGINYLVAWQDLRDSIDWNIYGTRVNQSGIVLDTNGIAISIVAYSQGNSSIAFDGTNYLIVWEDSRNGNYDIYGARVNQTGTILDSDCIIISTSPYGERYPSLAFDGTNYLVVWQSPSDIYGARVNSSGVVLDSIPIAISTATSDQESPSIAFDGINYLVAWQDERSGNNAWDIYGARVSPSGIVFEPNGIAISTAPDDQENPIIAFDGINFLVVWGDRRSGRDIYGARVNQLGIVLDTNGIPISTALHNQRYPCVAFDGANYLTVWSDTRNGLYDIYGARVNQTGMVLDTNGIPISTDTNSQQYPSITFDGTNYFLAWRDYRSGYEYDIYGARVNTSGIVIDSFPVSTQLGNQTNPSLARGVGNQILITWSGWTTEINGRPANTMRIWGKFYPFVGMEEERSMFKAKRFTLEIFPNPAKSYFTIRLPQSAVGSLLKIFDVSGKLVKVVPTSTIAQEYKEEVRISLKGINPGIYFLQLGTKVKKFLVVK